MPGTLRYSASEVRGRMLMLAVNPPARSAKERPAKAGAFNVGDRVIGYGRQYTVIELVGDGMVRLRGTRGGTYCGREQELTRVVVKQRIGR